MASFYSRSNASNRGPWQELVSQAYPRREVQRGLLSPQQALGEASRRADRFYAPIAHAGHGGYATVRPPRPSRLYERSLFDGQWPGRRRSSAWQQTVGQFYPYGDVERGRITPQQAIAVAARRGKRVYDGSVPVTAAGRPGQRRNAFGTLVSAHYDGQAVASGRLTPQQALARASRRASKDYRVSSKVSSSSAARRRRAYSWPARR